MEVSTVEAVTEAMKQAESVVRVVETVLGAPVVGAYLLGSAVLGGLRQSSDLDVFVVLDRRLTVRQREQLTGELLTISGEYPPRGPARPVELTAVVHEDVRPWRYPPRCEYQYGEWERAQYERGEVPSAVASPDLALLVTMVLQGDTAVTGPAPARVLDPVPRADLEHAITADIPESLNELDTDTRNVVLRLARTWTTLATGRIEPKDVAAGWALRQLPAEHRPVLEHARAVYLGAEEENWGRLRSSLRPYADYILGVVGTPHTR